MSPPLVTPVYYTAERGGEWCEGDASLPVSGLYNPVRPQA